VFERTPAPQTAAAADEEEDDDKPKLKFKTANPNDVKPKNIKLKDLNKLAAETEGDDEVLFNLTPPSFFFTMLPLRLYYVFLNSAYF
jgi:hypothetical protein